MIDSAEELAQLLMDDEVLETIIPKTELFSAFSTTSANPYLRCHRTLVPLSEFLDFHEQEREKAEQLKSPVMSLTPHRLTLGVPSMDALFHGGLELGQIT